MVAASLEGFRMDPVQPFSVSADLGSGAQNLAAGGRGPQKPKAEELGASSLETINLPRKRMEIALPGFKSLCEDCRQLGLSDFATRQYEEVYVGYRFRSPPRARWCHLCQMLWRSCHALRASLQSLQDITPDPIRISLINSSKTDVVACFKVLYSNTMIRDPGLFEKQVDRGALFLAVLPSDASSLIAGGVPQRHHNNN